MQNRHLVTYVFPCSTRFVCLFCFTLSLAHCDIYFYWLPGALSLVAKFSFKALQLSALYPVKHVTRNELTSFLSRYHVVFIVLFFLAQITITYRFFGFLQKKLATGQTVFPFPLNGLSVLALLPCADRSRRCCAHRGVPSLRSEARLYAWLFPVHGKPRAVRQEKRCGKNE